MKKIILLFALILTVDALSQNSYFVNDTAGQVPKRLTYLETGTPFNNAENVTITGYADGDLKIGLSDSTGAKKNTITFPSGSPILISSYYLPKNGSSTAMVWFWSVSGTINVHLQYRVW